MKNIIKPGDKRLVTKPIYKATCDHCGCVFEFEDEDIAQRTRNFGISNTIWVDCPFCGKELKINSPEIVREEPVEKFDNEQKDIKAENIVDKINDIYTLGKIVLMYADDPAVVVSSDNLDNKISFNVDITSTYNHQDFYDYYNLIYKIFRNNGFYRKELIDFINDNEKNAAALVKKKK